MFKVHCALELTMSRLLPAKHSLTRAIEVYFSRCHRQPLWLFDQDRGVDSEGMAEEIALPILALALHYCPDLVTEGSASSSSPEVYADTARTLIMLRLANGRVSFFTLQGLCLLAWVNFIGESCA